MSFDPTDGTTLTELIRLVRLRLGDFPQQQRQVETGDGVRITYRLRPNVYDTTTCTVDAEETVVTVDTDSSQATVDPAPLGEVIFNYSNTVWTDERIQEAINAAIDGLYPRFYVPGVNDDLVADGSGELLITTNLGDDVGPEDRITKVEYWNGSRWVRLDSWYVRSTPTSKYVVFEHMLTEGTQLRVTYVVRPGNLDSGAETIEGTAGLDSRTKEPLVLYSCAHLITDRIHHRIRDDRGHNTQGENPVKSYEIQNDAQYLRGQADLICERLAKERLSARVRY